MPANVLTDARIKRLAPREKPCKVFDGGGLFLYVSTTAKLWHFAYRLDGKQQTKSLGKYPLVTLAEARKLRDEAKRLLQAGETLKPKAVAIKPTLGRVSADYWASRQDLSADYRQNAVSALARYVLPRLGERPIDQIKRDDVMLILNGMNAAGRAPRPGSRPFTTRSGGSNTCR
ncbi:MAG: Arm DNA-binding domain-containing protein [Burkholderiales bacterium]|nr:Arm DNA-binding domain-containing protein [Burkholderiales bacterium]